MSFPYQNGDIILARVPNGKIYYVKIVTVSSARKEVRALFDDGSISCISWQNVFDGWLLSTFTVSVYCFIGYKL